jgi:hypothetical protein
VPPNFEENQGDRQCTLIPVAHVDSARARGRLAPCTALHCTSPPRVRTQAMTNVSRLAESTRPFDVDEATEGVGQHIWCGLVGDGL